MFHLLSRLSRSRPLCGLATRPMIRCGAATTGSQTSKGYYFRKYTLDADASRHFDEHFDQHVAANEKIILSTRRRPSTMEKRRQNIFVWRWLCISSSKFGCAAPRKRGPWRLPVATLLPPLRFGTYLDMVTEKLATCFESAMASVTDAAMPATPAGATVRLSARQQLQSVLNTTWDFYTTGACTESVSCTLWLLCKLILGLTVSGLIAEPLVAVLKSNKFVVPILRAARSTSSPALRMS